MFFHTWIVDSRASQHITSQRECLDDMVRVDTQRSSGVEVTTGGRCKITHTRSTDTLTSYKLNNAIYVPEFKFNLLTVSKMTRNLSFLVSFYPDLYVF